MSNLDALLDANLDSLADMPAFKPFCAGVHLVTVEMEAKEVNDKIAIIANFTYVAPVELADPADEAPKAGDKANVMCQLDNEYGQGTFKMLATAIAPALGLDGNASRRQVMEGCKGMTLQIVTTVRQGKKGTDQEGKEFLQLKAVNLPA